jgi:hypothetical protein
VEPGQLSCLSCGAGLRFRRRRLPGWRITTAVVGVLVLLAGALLGLGAGAFFGDDPPVRAGNPDTEPPTPVATATAIAPTATAPEATTPPPGEGSASGETLPEATGGSREPGGASQEPGGGTREPGTTTSPTTTTTPGATTPAPGATTTTPGATTPAPGASGSGATLTWPQGESGYTVVLASVRDRAAAERAAEQARNAGIDAGVLSSDDFESLRPGYWVAFAGRLSSARGAGDAAERHRAQGFPDAYPRRVRP